MTQKRYFEAVVFDLDGTLLDTLRDLAASMNRVLAKRHLPTHPEESYKYFVGDGAATLVLRAVPKEIRADKALLNQILTEFLEDYKENWDKNTRVYDGVDEMLDLVSKKGLKMAVLSNKPHEFTRLCVERYLGKWRFHEILGERKGIAKKPDPTGALKIAGSLSVDPAKVLYLGDTSIDMKTARSAGMFPAGVLWGFRDKKELEAAGAKAFLAKPSHIKDIIL